MAQLVNLIRTNLLGLHIFLLPGHVGGAGGKGAHAGAGIGNFRGGAELKNHVWIARFGALFDQVGNLNLLVGDAVNHIGVVPEDAEILGLGL